MSRLHGYDAAMTTASLNLKRRRGWLAWLGLGLGLILLAGALVAWLLWQGHLWLNMPAFARYPVQGLDVSAHQGKIDWPRVARGPWSFVYIKASEGGDFKDPSFASNWDASRKAGIARGAYHFFTFCRPGADQARNFIAMVPPEPGTLPPVADLEFGGNCSQRPEKAAFLKEVQVFLDALERHYGQRPVLYVTDSFAKAYLKDGALNAYPLWVRDIVREPVTFVDRPWLLWQFSNRGRVPGITGFVDQNVFAGSPSAFSLWLRARSGPQSPP